MSQNFEFHLLLAGPKNAGKSRFIEYQFLPSLRTDERNHHNDDLDQEKISVFSKNAHFNFKWDEIGCENLERELCKEDLQEIDAILFFLDPTHPKSLGQIEKCFNLVPDGIVCFLIRTKMDLDSKIKSERFTQFINAHNFEEIFSVSTKLGFNKERILLEIGDSIKDFKNAYQYDFEAGFNNHIDDSNQSFFVDPARMNLFRTLNRCRNSGLRLSQLHPPPSHQESPPRMEIVHLCPPPLVRAQDRSPSLLNLREEMLEELERLRDIMGGRPIEEDEQFICLSEEEKEEFRNFLKFFSHCPVCGAENHQNYLKNFYFSNEYEKIYLKEQLLNLIHHKELLNKMVIGIPCCECYRKFFEKKEGFIGLGREFEGFEFFL
ncbi:MAG: hypothetical protein EU548_01315 [Promethearchaeota archaeon]|nr:MAG: hypothetical protein EU548_01315 [Candidatus Lokiarchaeota archaeon]